MNKKTIVIIVASILTIVLGVGATLFFPRNTKQPSLEEHNTQGSSTGEETSSQEIQPLIHESSEMPLRPDPMPDDKDRDGLTDQEEQELGTNEREFDSDADLINDGDEVKIYKTDPLSRDTDGDGFSDGTEIRNGYNPNGEGTLDTIQ